MSSLAFSTAAWSSLRTAFSRTPGEDSSLWLERQIVFVRWFGILFAIPAVLFVPTVEAYRLQLLSVALFTAAYNTVLPRLAKTHPARISLIGAACDVVASACFVWIAGFDSQIYLVLFSIVIASSMRFGVALGLGAVVAFTILDLTSHLLQGNPELALIGFRSTVLAVDAILSAVLYRYAKQGDVLLKQTNQQLEAAIQRLRQLDVMKSDFISNASHELRTPLTAIRSFSEFLVDDARLHPDAQQFAQIINDESERLTRLVSDLLDLSRIEAGKTHRRFEEYDLAGQLRQVLLEQQPLADRKGLELRLSMAEELPAMWGDADAIHQVLLNLISNAVKFSSSGAVLLQAALQQDGVLVSVADTGVGISTQEQDRIFERFYQAGNGLTDKPSGTGLGLAIAKEVLEQHGTKLGVDSTPGQGSTFSFVLPLASPRPTADGAVDEGRVGASGGQRHHAA